MTHLTEDQQYLLLGKMGGLLSAEEEIQWMALVKSYPAILQDYEALKNALPAAELADSFSAIKKNDAWKDLAAQYKMQPQAGSTAKRIPLHKKLIAAAVIAGICTSAVLFIRYQKRDTNSDGQLAKIKIDKSIQLTLANGNAIDLSSADTVIDAASTQLTSTNKTLSYTSDKTVSGDQGMNHLTVPVGMDYKVNLNDGSEIWLNAATQLDFPFVFNGNTREITINGEAYIKVAKNASKPFIVHLPGSSVQVLGTEFNVNTYDPGVIKVALVEGKVNLKAPATESLILPGKEAVYRSGQSIEQSQFDEKMVLSWREGLFYFDGATLTEINKVVPRWFGIETVIDNPAISNRQFAGVLDRHQPIQFFLDDLKAISKINSFIDKNGVLHFK